MRIAGLLALVLTGAAWTVEAYRSPPVVTSIEASWPAADLVTQYLETLSLEAPKLLFPVIDFLVSFPHSHTAVKRLELHPETIATAERYAAQGISAIFATEGEIRPKDTLAMLEASLIRSYLLVHERGLLDSLRLSLANREASVRIEGMRRICEDRVIELEGSERVAATETGVSLVEDKRLGAAHAARTCESWIDVAGQVACTVDDFWSIVGEEQREASEPLTLPASASTVSAIDFHELDHVSPEGPNKHLPRVVLYGSPTSEAFPKLFAFLYQLSWPRGETIRNAETGKATRRPRPHPPRLQFALRWKPSAAAQAAPKKLVLSGYGAALDIKKSDYLAIDDRLAGGAAATAAVGERAGADVLPLEIEGEAPLKMESVRKADVPDLAVRTAQFIRSASDPFDAFVDITSDFPRLASHLPKLVPHPDPHLIGEVSANQMRSPLTRRPAFFLNGKLLTEDEVEPFALLRLMRQERKILNNLLSLDRYMTGGMARHILIAGGPKEPVVSRDRIDPELLGDLYDSTDRHEGGKVILWWNDLEKDRRYKSWSKSVRELLRPSYPGSMTQVARNLNNLVFIIDLSDPASIAHITNNIRQYVSRGIPIRFGVVPIVGPFGDTSMQTLMAQMLWYLSDKAGRAVTMSFLDQVAHAARGERISEDLLQRAYSQLRAQTEDLDGEKLMPFEQVRAYGTAQRSRSMQSRLASTRNYLERLGVAEEAQLEHAGSVFLNGGHFPLNEDFAQNLQRTLGLHTQFLAQEVYMRSLTDDDDVTTYFAELPRTHKRRNPHIIPSDDGHPLRIINLLQALEGATSSWLEEGFFEGTSGKMNETTGNEIEDPPAPASLFVIADLDTTIGAELARNALRLADSTTNVRVVLLHNPADPTSETHSWSLSRIYWHLIETKAVFDTLPKELVQWIELELTKEGPSATAGRDWNAENPLKKLLPSGVAGRDAGEAALYWDLLQLTRHRFGFEAGQSGLVLNGRVVGPFAAEYFTLLDYRTLLDFELEKRIEPLAAAVKSSGLELEGLLRAQMSRIYMIANSIVGTAHLPDPAVGMFAANTGERRRDYLQLHGNHTVISGKLVTSALYEVAVVVDPASPTAQRWAPILRTLNKMNSTSVSVYLNPTLHLTEVPIKRFYQFSFEHAMLFDPAGAEGRPEIRFNAIPPDVLVTYAADIQRSWLAFPRSGVHDLDNIKLADLAPQYADRGIEAVLELEALTVEGHAREVPSSRPPRGLQLELSRPGSPGSTDTSASIVMSNLGYCQLKANPGRWHLGLRQGRSSEVYEIESVGADGWKSRALEQTGQVFSVSTLEGKTLYPRFRRRPGHEQTELLDESAAPASRTSSVVGSLWDRFKTMLPFVAPASTDLVTTGKRADINVFTVASGHLYERMAFLMIVSVLRHTKSTVKFWFIQNFLSPSFKAFIPHMAREYGFDYELVTYKWPHWLRGQTEKQRTIWGYKILFLDVLFPLELDRVIFVDSDQIVRADLKELVDLDLQGAPYAYAPMGGYDGEKPEMEGFRFWKTGYWAKHLQGRPYHISALYVVDLDRFRQIAAGDLLRQQYQALSADPGSLANLDQDLPNNMTPNLPIYTLPKEWLWCETWCSDEALATAKTIDLCNNPLTHEPKLQRAKRLIPEWTEYDDEVAALAKRVAEAQGSGESAAFGARADELEQAVQQQEERDAFLGEASAAGEQVSPEHVKDEL